MTSRVRKATGSFSHQAGFQTRHITHRECHWLVVWAGLTSFLEVGNKNIDPMLGNFIFGAWCHLHVCDCLLNSVHSLANLIIELLLCRVGLNSISDCLHRNRGSPQLGCTHMIQCMIALIRPRNIAGATNFAFSTLAIPTSTHLGSFLCLLGIICRQVTL